MSRKNKPMRQAQDDSWLKQTHSYAQNRATLAWLKEETEKCQTRLEKILKKIHDTKNIGGVSHARHNRLNFFPLRKVITASEKSKPARSLSHHPRV